MTEQEYNKSMSRIEELLKKKESDLTKLEEEELYELSIKCEQYEDENFFKDYI